jgi:hypothetical protein
LISFPIDSKEINTMDVYSNAINTVSMDGLLVGRFEIIAIRIGFIAALSFSFSVSLYFFLVLPFFARHRLLMSVHVHFSRRSKHSSEKKKKPRSTERLHSSTYYAAHNL